MKVQFEVTADIVETRTQMGVDLTSDEIEELSEELEIIIESYFEENPWATVKVNRMVLVNVEASGNENREIEK